MPSRKKISQRVVFWSFALILAATLPMFGCSQGEGDSGKTVVAVNQYVTHPILDAVREGLEQRLNEEFGEKVEIVVKNSNADAMTCRQINEQFVRQKVDVIVALGTPAAQSAVQVSGNKVPVVFGAITDPVGSKLAKSLEQPGGNKTGTTNRWPFADQVQLIREVLPEAKTIGVVVNPGEENCNAGVEVFRNTANQLGLDLSEMPVSNSSEVKAATQALAVKQVDVILVSPSNTVFSALDAMIQTAHEAGIPVLGGDESAVAKGSIATYGFSNRDVGVATADVIIELLGGDKKSGDIPVASPKTTSLFVNENAVDKAGVTIPENLLSQAVKK